MKVVLGADLHCTGRTDPEREMSVRVLEDAFELAEREGAEAVWILGDFLHFKYGLECRLLLECNELIEYYEKRGIGFTCILGNHDEPWPNTPELSPLNLLRGQILSQPYVWHNRGTMYAFLPWSEPDTFKEQSKDLAIAARGHLGLKFLFSHVSLAEGYVSPSNFQADSQIRMGDLYPDVWDKVFLGDYHSHQHVGTKITYLGAPIPRTFGDHNNCGYWLLDIRNNGTWYFTNLGLVSKFPQYSQLTIGPAGPPSIPDYDPENKYIVTAAMCWIPELTRLYPGIQIKPLSGTFTIPQNSRIPVADIKNPFSTFKAWLALKGLDHETYYPIGEEALKQCLGTVR